MTDGSRRSAAARTTAPRCRSWCGRGCARCGRWQRARAGAVRCSRWWPAAVGARDPQRGAARDLPAERRGRARARACADPVPLRPLVEDDGVAAARRLRGAERTLGGTLAGRFTVSSSISRLGPQPGLVVGLHADRRDQLRAAGRAHATTGFRLAVRGPGARERGRGLPVRVHGPAERPGQAAAPALRPDRDAAASPTTSSDPEQALSRRARRPTRGLMITMLATTLDKVPSADPGRGRGHPPAPVPKLPLRRLTSRSRLRRGWERRRGAGARVPASGARRRLRGAGVAVQGGRRAAARRLRLRARRRRRLRPLRGARGAGLDRAGRGSELPRRARGAASRRWRRWRPVPRCGRLVSSAGCRSAGARGLLLRRPCSSSFTSGTGGSVAADWPPVWTGWLLEPAGRRRSSACAGVRRGDLLDLDGAAGEQRGGRRDG